MQLNAITQCHMQGNSEHVTPQTLSLIDRKQIYCTFLKTALNP
ncbi:hypothetical protein M513_09765, partial [Trichuris suis]